MGDYISWDTEFPQPKKGGSGNGNNIYLRLEANQPRRIRPVHKPYMFWKYFHQAGPKDFRTAIIADPDQSSLKDKYPQNRPSRKFAMVVFDREDDNKLKIMEFGSTVFAELKSYKNITKQEPGGPHGADITICKVLAPGAPLRETEYTVKFEDRAPFTAEEMALLKSEEVAEKYNLKKVFAPQTDEEVESILFSEVNPKKVAREQREAEYQQRRASGQDGGGQTRPQAQQTSKAAAAPVTVPAETEDDPFNWG
ncbi:MAG: hypothetical protein HC888_00390 [Candidatus Competibacteraceae bacterium]|nr:hypothetical protein [Candidatus Competibacteraceae bacterium]